MKQNAIKVIERKDFQSLFDALGGNGYDIYGPVMQDKAIIYDQITSVDDLPIGWIDRHDKGSYRLLKRKKKMLFDYVVGPHTWKKFLYSPVMKILEAKRDNNGFVVTPAEEEPQKRAFIGVRSCELHAMAIHDRVFMGGKYEDASYRLRRANLFIVAVNCTRAGENCFCSSMNTGPKATSGFDLALTEVIASNQHIFVVEIGSEAGAEIMSSIPNREAGEKDIQAAEKAIQKAASNMGRKLDVAGIRETLIDGFDSLHWEDIASRCLTCGNCTMVCPTCFCTDIQDVTDLSGNHAERLRQWDTCFREEFSYIHGGSIRSTDMSRYRQWMMHKLAYWYDQFGVSGCVGCGRCITWCPVGIDITEEARIIREKG